MPQILVFNKLDAMDPAAVPHLLSDSMELDGASVSRIYVSAKTGEGLPELRSLLASRAMSQAGALDPNTPGESPSIENVLP
ncbi:hypothetical protein D9M69_558130 [compost metagenome]